jgi:hypothetical protein
MTASAAINTLIDLEPRLSHGIESSDYLQLEIYPFGSGGGGLFFTMRAQLTELI